jgi:hypothetical protein
MIHRDADFHIGNGRDKFGDGLIKRSLPSAPSIIAATLVTGLGRVDIQRSQMMAAAGGRSQGSEWLDDRSGWRSV